MSEELESNLRSLKVEKYTMLAEQNGWSLAYAEGYMAGQVDHRLENPLVGYARVGKDEFALGYRAGYFRRGNAANASVIHNGVSHIKPVSRRVRQSGLVWRHELP